METVLALRRREVSMTTIPSDDGVSRWTADEAQTQLYAARWSTLVRLATLLRGGRVVRPGNTMASSEVR